MLYLFYGNDAERVKAEARRFRDEFEKKSERSAIFKIDPETISENALREYASMQGLFGEAHLVIAEELLSMEGDFDEIFPILSSSPNTFLVVEGDLLFSDVSRIESVGGKATVFSKKDDKAQRENPFFPIFSLADALGERDRKKLWVLFSRAITAGVSAEEIHRILFWEIKAIAQARESISAKDAGLSPFVFTKAKRASTRFSRMDVFNFSDALLRATHTSRQGGAELENSLERIILKI